MSEMKGPETAGVAVADAWGLGVGLGTAVAVLTDDGRGWNEKGDVELAGPVKNDPPRKSPDTRTAQVTRAAPRRRYLLDRREARGRAAASPSGRLSRPPSIPQPSWDFGPSYHRANGRLPDEKGP
jgi:hypothetical protein